MLKRKTTKKIKTITIIQMKNTTQYFRFSEPEKLVFLSKKNKTLKPYIYNLCYSFKSVIAVADKEL